VKRLFSHHQLLGAAIVTTAIGLIQFLSLAGAAGQSRSVPEGARVALSFTGGTNFVLGDVIELTFTLSNTGARAFQYETGGDYRDTGFPTRFKFTVTDEKGVALPAETWMNMGGLSGPRPLKPGEEYRQPLRLQNYVRVSQPGVFSVRVVHDFGWQATPAEALPVAEAKIAIALPTPEQAEKRVRAIMSNAESEKGNALGAYWTKTDFRYLSHPVFLPALERCAAEGNEQAMEGIQRIESKEATLALMRLLDNKMTNVVHAAALFLSRRMPPRIVNGYPRRLGWYGTPEEAAASSALWVPEAAEPLRAAAQKLLRSGVVNYVSTGAFIIETIGKEEDGSVVLDALDGTLKEWKVRSHPDDNILNAPGAGDALINALAGLRERGYLAPKNGGINVIMARFLELADPAVPRSEGWEQLLEAFFTQNPPMLREAAVRALPRPPTGKWEKPLMDALNDADRGVMRTACSVAGESKNQIFVEPLANIVRTEHHEWAVREASEALNRLGAHWAATDAWIERLADEKMYSEGLRFLAEKLEHPKSGGSTGRTDLARESRIAMRVKWQHFFADPERRALVQAGKPVPVSESQARDLFSGAFSYCIEGGKSWPPEE
jgi:hypothetical protein